MEAMLQEENRFLLRLEKLRFDKDGNVKTLAAPFTLIETPMDYDYDENDNEEQFYKDVGKPMIVYKGTFNTEVPYVLKGWSESVDLTKENQEKLKEELVDKYLEL